MKNLNKNQWLAVCISLLVLAYLFFAGPIMSLFNTQPSSTLDNSQSDNILIEDALVGQGALVGVGDKLTVHYVGTLSDGKVFDSSRDRGTPFTFTLGVGEVIQGWDQGIVGMKVGGLRRLTIPPRYGYGSQGVGPIPPNSTLIFEVELIEATKSQ